ncbi:rod shape-determining protein MreC [Patescibacteria group bacterium]|nr:MAG: rod shape-determining protein MreC [Patescibacteria group bacterium]
MRRETSRLIRYAFVAAALGAAAIWFRTPLERMASAAVAPLARSGRWISGSIEEDEIGKLEARVASLSTDRAELELLRDENLRLRDRLAFQERTRFNAVQATIVLRDASRPTRRFVLDRGADDGVAPGAAVVAGNGQYVGKVVGVTAATATVAEATAPGEKTATTLLNLTRTIGLSEGDGSSLLTMRFIPHDQAIAVNDLVVTSGLEDHVPAGLVVGVVNAVTDDPTSPFQDAVVEPIVDLRRETSLAILVD